MRNAGTLTKKREILVVFGMTSLYHSKPRITGERDGNIVKLQKKRRKYEEKEPTLAASHLLISRGSQMVQHAEDNPNN